MLFNSFVFIVFFTIVSGLYFVIPHKYRWILLLIASYIFYMAWKPELIILIVFSTFINYAISLGIDKEKVEERRRKLLILSLFINFGFLFIFKYLVFFNDTFMKLFTMAGAEYPIKAFDIILPMGISFYTFQAASYTIDVYRRRIKPVKHYGIFSLYITFFPQLVAGPIERSENLLPQFYNKHHFDFQRVVYGLEIMLWGFFKKIVIADRVSAAVNTIYNSPQNFSGLYLALATFLFAFQIYCDFSGYSDIAVGCAKILGFDLMENFKSPYLSKNINEFWKRWHISLSSWFMDYVYIPLGGNRNGKGQKRRNLLITFLVSGLWHGANWTFVMWGGIHGIYQIVGSLTESTRKKIKIALHIENSWIMNIFSIFFTFGLVSFAWIFFRSNNINDAIHISKHILTGFRGWFDLQYIYEVITSLGINLFELKTIFFAIGTLMLSEILSGKQQVYAFVGNKNIILKTAFYVFIASIILTSGVFYEAGEFIYFQF